MSRRQDHPRKSQQRTRIASLAARLMTEDGINDPALAKRKAARRLGLPETAAMLDDGEVHGELRTYQRLFHEDEQRARNIRLLRTAARLMATMVRFNPYLTGSVLDGTAGRFAEIDIQLFPDSAKDVEIFLLSRNQPYETSEPRHAGPDTPETRVHLDWNGIPVQLAVFALHQERSNRRGGGSGRARAEAVTALLEQE